MTEIIIIIIIFFRSTQTDFFQQKTDKNNYINYDNFCLLFFVSLCLGVLKFPVGRKGRNWRTEGRDLADGCGGCVGRKGRGWRELFTMAKIRQNRRTAKNRASIIFKNLLTKMEFSVKKCKGDGRLGIFLRRVGDFPHGVPLFLVTLHRICLTFSQTTR